MCDFYGRQKQKKDHLKSFFVKDAPWLFPVWTYFIYVYLGNSLFVYVLRSGYESLKAAAFGAEPFFLN